MSSDCDGILFYGLHFSQEEVVGCSDLCDRADDILVALRDQVIPKPPEGPADYLAHYDILTPVGSTSVTIFHN